MSEEMRMPLSNRLAVLGGSAISSWATAIGTVQAISGGDCKTAFTTAAVTGLFGVGAVLTSSLKPRSETSDLISDHLARSQSEAPQSHGFARYPI